MTIKEAIRLTRKQMGFIMSDRYPDEKTCEALSMALDALREKEGREKEPLTMAELRRMNGETVYCLEYNVDVKIRARKYGLIHVSYKFPGEYGECKALGLTFYRTRPEEDTP